MLPMHRTVYAVYAATAGGILLERNRQILKTTHILNTLVMAGSFDP